MVILGSDWLVKILHITSQSLLVPVIVGLLLLFSYVLLELGALIYESRGRARSSAPEVGELLNAIQVTGDVGRAAESEALTGRQRDAIGRLLALAHLNPASRRALARRILEEEEMKRARVLDRTELVVKIGPALGLMGTLIPLGPGLAALGSGDVRGLAQAVVIAFDTTVVGLAAGGLAFFISRTRRRWYREYLSTLEVVMEGIVEVLDDAEREKVVVGLRGGT